MCADSEDRHAELVGCFNGVRWRLSRDQDRLDPGLAEIAHDPPERASDSRRGEQHHLAGLTAAEQSLSCSQQPRPKDAATQSLVAGHHF
jgi:hypothetical protein